MTKTLFELTQDSEYLLFKLKEKYNTNEIKVICTTIIEAINAIDIIETYLLMKEKGIR